MLQSLSFDNAVIAILLTAFLGTCMGYINAKLVMRLTRDQMVPVKSMQ
jgi:hypothetical protein